MAAPFRIPTPRLPPCPPLKMPSRPPPELLTASSAFCTAQHASLHRVRQPTRPAAPSALIIQRHPNPRSLLRRHGAAATLRAPEIGIPPTSSTPFRSTRAVIRRGCPRHRQGRQRQRPSKGTTAATTIGTFNGNGKRSSRGRGGGRVLADAPPAHPSAATSPVWGAPQIHVKRAHAGRAGCQSLDRLSPSVLAPSVLAPFSGRSTSSTRLRMSCVCHRIVTLVHPPPHPLSRERKRLRKSGNIAKRNIKSS